MVQGKTTTINLFLGFTEPTSGAAIVDGVEVARNPAVANDLVSVLRETAAGGAALLISTHDIFRAKDVTEPRRDRRVVIMALAVTAILTSTVRVASYEADRAATLEVDRGTWEGQGARNPHSAAHFAKCAFKPLTMSAVLDPGITSYAGSAVWVRLCVPSWNRSAW